MTYNFDPDTWYDIEAEYLKARYRRREITRQELDHAMASLEAKLEAMWGRLDGSYRVLPGPMPGSGNDQKR